ncbi:Type 1 glutamine amidotransferase-like domain-containing protein [Bacillus pfraonensis]|uniref:Type 1 glutamine amidotransferase-like domain-containing protein n=1 Tax=Bacillus TaxID=1386 RepID=UPI002A56B626|nr:Type 1 glutamine amidotransferase-like domain-containing protein [Bacillus pseudomycoides]
MGRFIFLSDVENVHSKINNYIKDNIDNKKKSVAYLRAKSDEENKYFAKVKNYYNSIGIEEIRYFDLDKNYSEQEISNIYNYSAIHLSGGNTFQFLDRLKEKKMIQPLINYSENKGLLIGVSAGSIIMTEEISVANYLDENHVKLDSFDALNFVDFAFLPHYNILNKDSINFKLREYSKNNKKIIYACCDGSGIIVNNKQIELVGEVVEFSF